jgi:hypothetical protein
MPTSSPIVPLVLFALLGVWTLFHVVRALRTGSVQTKNSRHERCGQPFLFWLIVTIQLLFAIGTFVAVGMYLWNH